MYWQIKCIHLYANDEHESKTKDSVYNMHLNFLSFFSKKKCALHMGKYGILFILNQVTWQRIH